MNQPGVMQGMVNQPKPQPVVMPGQSNSNINAQTMQVENNSQPSASVVQPNATPAGVNNAGVPNQINIPNSSCLISTTSLIIKSSSL